MEDTSSASNARWSTGYRHVQCAKIARAVVCSDHVLGFLDELKELENKLSEHWRYNLTPHDRRDLHEEPLVEDAATDIHVHSTTFTGGQQPAAHVGPYSNCTDNGYHLFIEDNRDTSATSAGMMYTVPCMNGNHHSRSEQMCTQSVVWNSWCVAGGTCGVGRFSWMETLCVALVQCP